LKGDEDSFDRVKKPLSCAERRDCMHGSEFLIPFLSFSRRQPFLVFIRENAQKYQFLETSIDVISCGSQRVAIDTEVEFLHELHGDFDVVSVDRAHWNCAFIGCLNRASPPLDEFSKGLPDLFEDRFEPMFGKAFVRSHAHSGSLKP
jgi:hypothetical protein